MIVSIEDKTQKQKILPIKLSELTLEEQGILYSMLNEGANNITLKQFKDYFTDSIDEIKEYLDSLIKKHYVKVENEIYSIVPDLNDHNYFKIKN